MGLEAPHHPVTERRPLLEALIDRMLAADQRGASLLVAQATGLGWSADDIRFELITPALYEIGDRWERGRLGVADEHLAASVCEWLLSDLTGRAPRAASLGRRAVVGCSQGELHVIGAHMVAHVLVEHGWAVLHLGADTPPAAWAQIVRARRPDAAVVSTTTQPRLEQVGPTLAAIKAASPACRTVVGGQAYWDRLGAAATVEADLVVLDPRELAERLALAVSS